MAREFRRSVPTRHIILALFAIIVIPGVLFSALLLARFADAERGRYRQEAMQVASTAASAVDQQLRGWQATLQTLGTSEALQDGNLEAFSRQAAAVKAFIGVDVGLRELSGQQLVNTRRPWGTPLPLTPLPGDDEVIAGRRPVVSNVFQGALAQQPLIAVIVPIMVKGSPRYLLHVSAETKLVADVVRANAIRAWLIGVGDRAGVYVTRSEEHERFSGHPGVSAFLAQAKGGQGVFVGTSANGDEVLVGYARSELSGWLVAANIRQAVIERPLWTAVQWLLAGGIISLLLSSLAALFLWRMVATPLSALTKASAFLGRSPEPLSIPTRLREFITLRDALSDASRQLAGTKTELEDKVRERTAELVEAHGKVKAEADERHRIEAMLAQAQKMEAVGNLTGGVAHDFNNLLQVIGGNIELVGREAELSDKARGRLQNAMTGVKRGARLASQLLAFGRRQALAPRAINVGRLLRGMDDLLRRSLGEAVQIETIVAGGLWNTFADPTNVENALLNLAINARDAMEGTGKLTIEAGNSFLDEMYARANNEVVAGQYVAISVTDTGSGMSPEILEKVFEPFFSTKPQGKGTGLGLSMVYGFVKQSGGHVKIYSEPGHGTTVRLYLPRSHKAEDNVVEYDSSPVTGGSETILLVEDDAAVRDTVVSLLGELGYHVLTAEDAAQALAVIESSIAIDLLFTDVVMPGALKSPELARKAKQRLPNLHVLFTSGYTENSIVHGGRLDEGVSLLSKPYTREALARKVRELLGSAAVASELANASVARRLKVLLVEDDALIRMDTADLIGAMGHTVLEAANAHEAMQLAATQEIDRLVTDVGLPDLSGIELANRLRETRPHLPVVFASGMSQLPGVALDSRTRLVVKPYQSSDLESALA
ncbi:hypothetical protein ASE63_12425 [Bosea sp. Root381]|uniref:response regulator n=1 Tax=Bosea sp. Root381 TaxID=1736524 RepID=UPI0006FE862C|nr:response regulator [Bosea sp. Root381]KRD95821.1 hypothetical protein ASE63_12425 [Bosea sp. Root381]